ncbi:3'-5' exonuclease [Persephonella atlantica]|uniref:3'-5' exonuclease n=1 Tax=Persephonella atlantica TaxID=2699429 RepID=A0ABS1GI07_9AQUI|nr:3'-5' exonuclease [Persephonella atlantica]MBK3332567.1 3'-5' exonuclease [Persephonella atlantica]
MDLLKKLKILRYRNNPYFQKFYQEIKEESLDRITFTSIDLETTGLDISKDEIISFGGIKIKNLKISLGDSFYRVVKPSADIKKESILVHGITPSEIEDAPPIEEILPEFLQFIKGTVIVGYFVTFDIKMLSRYTQKLYGFPILNPYIDLRDFAFYAERKRYRQIVQKEDMTLEELARRYNIPVIHRHNAYYDSLITGLIFIAMVKKNRRFFENFIKKVV